MTKMPPIPDPWNCPLIDLPEAMLRGCQTYWQHGHCLDQMDQFVTRAAAVLQGLLADKHARYVTWHNPRSNSWSWSPRAPFGDPRRVYPNYVSEYAARVDADRATALVPKGIQQ